MEKTPRLTMDHVRLVHRDIADAGPDPAALQFSEADYDEHLEEFLDRRPDAARPILVFAYGSLIWKPAFAPAASARANALGWQRAFTLRMVRFRGTRERPGLMMQIDRGGTCEGVVQEIDRTREWSDLSALWRREMTLKPPGNFPRWIEVRTGGATRAAIAFTANPESPNYAGRLAPDEVALILSAACGHWGSGAEYLLQTIISLDAHGIRDPYLWDLQERVAARIEAAQRPA
jgi:glutathione-specific gamma-glutamylcyclotransferase